MPKLPRSGKPLDTGKPSFAQFWAGPIFDRRNELRFYPTDPMATEYPGERLAPPFDPVMSDETYSKAWYLYSLDVHGVRPESWARYEDARNIPGGDEPRMVA